MGKFIWVHGMIKFTFLFSSSLLFSQFPQSAPPIVDPYKNTHPAHIDPYKSIYHPDHPHRSTNVLEEFDNPEKEKIDRILLFWFGPLDSPSYFPSDRIALWEGDPESSLIIRERFFNDYQKAAAGQYNHWAANPRGRLALIIILDQFSRRIFPNQTQMFQTDAMARGLALEGIKLGEDLKLFPVERIFFYMPIQHTEDAAMQDYSVQLIRKLLVESPPNIKPIIEEFLKLAINHQDLIRRFGRFPHRNEVLERQSTTEEKIYLAQKKALRF